MSVQKNGQEIVKGTRNKKTGMLEVPLETQQTASVINKILAQTSKPELSQYLHAALFSPTTASLIKDINYVFLKTLTGLTKKLVQRHLKKSRNTKMVHLQMKRHRIKSTKGKPSDIGSKQSSEADTQFPKNEDSPVNLIRSLM